jgi:hypothetical protein
MHCGNTYYRKTSFVVPIFNQKIYVFVFNSLSDIRQLYKIDDAVDLNDRQAVVFEFDGGEIVAFETNIQHGLVAHEALHITKRIMKKVGIKQCSFDDSEVECYLLGYITDKISTWFEKLENEDNKKKNKTIKNK